MTHQSPTYAAYDRGYEAGHHAGYWCGAVMVLVGEALGLLGIGVIWWMLR